MSHLFVRDRDGKLSPYERHRPTQALYHQRSGIDPCVAPVCAPVERAGTWPVLAESVSCGDLYVSGDHVDGAHPSGAWDRRKRVVLSRYGGDSILAAGELVDSRVEVLRVVRNLQDVLVVQSERAGAVECHAEAALWVRWIEGFRYLGSDRMPIAAGVGAVPIFLILGTSSGASK